MFRWEAHIWIGGINKQKYLGGYEKEEHAAEAYDMAALKTKGFDTPTNFDKSRCAAVRCRALPCVLAADQVLRRGRLPLFGCTPCSLPYVVSRRCRPYSQLQEHPRSECECVWQRRSS